MMRIHSPVLRSHKILTVIQVRVLPAIVLVGLTLPWVNGCTSQQDFAPEMTLQVSAGAEAGSYVAKGRTNLPQPEIEKRKQPIVITVQAIRLLTPKPNAKVLKNTKPIHAVIARQRIETTDGNWEAKLNLLQPTPKNGLLEVWQINPADIPAELEPSGDVTFLAATESIDRTLKFSPDVTKMTADGRKPVLQSAADGSLFLQAEATQSIAPPKLPATPPTAIKPIVKVDSKTASGKVDAKQNNAPLLPQEFMR